MKNLLDIKSTFDNYDSDENKSAYEEKRERTRKLFINKFMDQIQERQNELELKGLIIESRNLKEKNWRSGMKTHKLRKDCPSRTLKELMGDEEITTSCESGLNDYRIVLFKRQLKILEVLRKGEEERAASNHVILDAVCKMKSTPNNFMNKKMPKTPSLPLLHDMSSVNLPQIHNQTPPKNTTININLPPIPLSPIQNTPPSIREPISRKDSRISNFITTEPMSSKSKQNKNRKNIETKQRSYSQAPKKATERISNLGKRPPRRPCKESGIVASKNEIGIQVESVEPDSPPKEPDKNIEIKVETKEEPTQTDHRGTPPKSPDPLNQSYVPSEDNNYPNMNIDSSWEEASNAIVSDKDSINTLEDITQLIKSELPQLPEIPELPQTSNIIFKIPDPNLLQISEDLPKMKTSLNTSFQSNINSNRSPKYVTKFALEEKLKKEETQQKKANMKTKGKEYAEKINRQRMKLKKPPVNPLYMKIKPKPKISVIRQQILNNRKNSIPPSLQSFTTLTQEEVGGSIGNTSRSFGKYDKKVTFSVYETFKPELFKIESISNQMGNNSVSSIIEEKQLSTDLSSYNIALIEGDREAVESTKKESDLKTESEYQGQLSNNIPLIEDDDIMKADNLEDVTLAFNIYFTKNIQLPEQETILNNTGAHCLIAKSFNSHSDNEEPPNIEKSLHSSESYYESINQEVAKYYPLSPLDHKFQLLDNKPATLGDLWNN